MSLMCIFIVPPQIGRSKEMVDHRCIWFRPGIVGDRPKAGSFCNFALSCHYKGMYIV